MHHFYTAAWDALFCNFNHFDFNCQHEVFYLKMGYFYFFKYVKGFCSSPALLLENQPQQFYLNQTCFACCVSPCLPFPCAPSAFEPPDSATDLWNKLPYLFLVFFCLQLLSSTSAPSPFLSHSWKKACSKLSSELACVTSYTADISENVYQLLQS